MKTLKRNLIQKEYSSQEIENFITGEKLQNRVKKGSIDWWIFKRFCFKRSKRNKRMVEPTSSQT